MKKLVEMLNLSNREVVITGAAAGIGKATALRFAETGANLHLIDIDLNGLEKTKKEAEELAAKVNIYRIDLSNKQEIDEFWNRLNSTPDILVNVAGIYPFKELTKLEEAFLLKIYKVNLFSVFWMCKNFIKKLLEAKKPGTIINTSSIEAILPVEANLAHYTSSKAAILALTRAIARDYGKYGIRANAVLPGGIKTPGVMKTASKLGPKALKIAKEYTKRVPIGRFGEPDDVATVILFLATDLSRYITGAGIPIDGGLTSM
ncbi:MAG: SDR family NAD(P)-dependent oxidoreductase [Candidatus Njordarchaeia archaeon]